MKRKIGIWHFPTYAEIARGHAKMWREVAKLDEPKKDIARRKNFGKQAREAILIYQNYQCAKCLNFLKYPEFDHVDGDPSNNHISNCQALCPNCHAEKTRTPIHTFWGNF